MKQSKVISSKAVLERACFLLFFLFCNSLSAQNAPDFSDSGAPFIRNYPPTEYGGHNQNWGIVQDHRGVIYFGNSYGVMEYDGVSWNLTTIPNARIARSLAINADHRIFVGGYGEIGYMAPDATHQLQFISLLPQLEERYRDFTDVWQTLSTPEGIYFVTHKYLIRWNGESMRVWQPPTAFNSAFWVNGQFYIHQQETGLMLLTGDALQLAPMGEKLANERFKAMLPFDQQGQKRILITTQNNGLFLYDGASLVRFATEVDELLRQAHIFCAIRLSNGQYALGTMQRGIVIIDAAGKLRKHLEEAGGLQDDAVLSLYEDRQHALWAGMQVGIARVETGSPLRYFDERQGIRGSIWDMLRHEGRLYFASIMGLFYLDENTGVFRQVKGVSSQCWTLLPFGKSLLAGTFDGFFEIKNGQVRRISDGFTFSLHRSQQDSLRVFAGLRNGIKSLYAEGGQWRDEGQIEGIDQEVRHIYETPVGKLWLVDYFSGLTRLDFSKGYARQPEIVRYDSQHGLPPADRVVAFPTDRGLRFATLKGVVAFDEASKRFYRDSTLIQNLPNPTIPLFAAARDPSGSLWLVSDDSKQSGVARRQAEGAYTWEQTPFLRIAKMPGFSVYPDPLLAQVTWIGGTDRVVRYDGGVPSNHAVDFPTLLREVVANGDSILYAGAAVKADYELQLAYSFNSLRFRYAAPSFDDESKNEYQYLLEDYDKGWSNWSTETYKDYTNLPPGKYRFLVRARNIYGHIGETAVCNLYILPPFYRTWWAYLLYLLLMAGAGFKLWQLVLRRMRQKQLQELKQLEFNKLKELDELKSRFFANITHEFRTPLTLLIGPAENAMKRLPEMGAAELHGVLLNVRRNGYRLLNLVNQLLDLSRLEAGKLRLAPVNGDFVAFLRYQVESCHSYAETRRIKMSFESNIPELEMAFDPEKIQTIVVNLLSNALKFTPEGGRIELKMTTNGLPLSESTKVVFQISDTGSGIPREELNRVFDRFYQVDNSTTRPGEGAGIGLAMVQELVKLMQGSVNVTSTSGVGTSFQISLPYTPPQKQLQALDATLSTEEKPLMAARLSASLPYDGQFADDADATSSATHPSSLPQLLIIEDNPDVVAYLRTCLEGSYQLEVAYNGKQGIEKALNNIPDLIISDVMMPEKDGYEVCDTLKNDERTSHIPIVLLTAKADSASKIAGLRRGADAYLPKPFNLEELLVRLEMLLERQKRMAAYFGKKAGMGTDTETPEPKEVYDIEDAFISKVRQVIEENIADYDFAMPQLCQILSMSRSQLLRKMKALVDTSPSDFIRLHRLQKAKTMLETEDLTVSEVAYLVGYKDVSHFSRSFREMFGVPPSKNTK
ncbi:MAG: ATP-binding protein [Saprospiraceae bacterium]